MTFIPKKECVSCTHELPETHEYDRCGNYCTSCSADARSRARTPTPTREEKKLDRLYASMFKDDTNYQLLKRQVGKELKGVMEEKERNKKNSIHIIPSWNPKLIKRNRQKLPEGV